MHRSTTRRNVTPTDIPITVTTTAEGCFWELDEGITLELAVFTVEEVERATCFDSVSTEPNLKAVLIRLLATVTVIEGVAVITLLARWLEYGVANCKGEIEGS